MVELVLPDGWTETEEGVASPSGETVFSLSEISTWEGRHSLASSIAQRASRLRYEVSAHDAHGKYRQVLDESDVLLMALVAQWPELSLWLVEAARNLCPLTQYMEDLKRGGLSESEVRRRVRMLRVPHRHLFFILLRWEQERIPAAAIAVDAIVAEMARTQAQPSAIRERAAAREPGWLTRSNVELRALVDEIQRAKCDGLERWRVFRILGFSNLHVAELRSAIQTVLSASLCDHAQAEALVVGSLLGVCKEVDVMAAQLPVSDFAEDIVYCLAVVGTPRVRGYLAEVERHVSPFSAASEALARARLRSLG